MDLNRQAHETGAMVACDDLTYMLPVYATTLADVNLRLPLDHRRYHRHHHRPAHHHLYDGDRSVCSFTGLSRLVIVFGFDR